MDRRRFLVASLDTTAVAAAGGAAHAATASAPARVPASTALTSLTSLDAVALQQAMQAGTLSAEALVQACLARIDAVDRAGPLLRAVIELDPQAVEVAAALDAERRTRGARGPLHGLPVLLKDNIDTRGPMMTSAGSLALADAPALHDAPLVARLRAAGCVVLGKTNLSEWANFRSTHSTSGWSSRGGQTRNPHVLDRNPSGSSSGSGAAVAAGLAPLAVGTETDGSVTCPAAACGIVGLKPTVGRISRGGIVPISHSQDTAGPMARSVADAALLLAGMAGPDPADRATRAAQAHPLPDLAPLLTRDGLRGARIGVAREFFGGNDAADRVIEHSLRALADAGAVLVDPVKVIKDSGALGAAELEVLWYELKPDLNAYLAQRGMPAGRRTLAELIAWNQAHAGAALRWFGQEHFIAADAKGPLTEAAYRRARATSRRMAGPQGIDAALRRHRLDAIVAPTTGPAWTTDPVNGDHYGGACSSPAAVAGYPHLTVPAGFVTGLPIGLSFFAGAWSEATLLRLGYAFEQATLHRREPAFLPTLAA
ncbi:MAG: amidase [Rubrivivax sp.]